MKLATQRRVGLLAAVVHGVSNRCPGFGLGGDDLPHAKHRSDDLPGRDPAQNTLEFQARYSLSAYVCWNGTKSWSYSSAYPTYSNQNYPYDGMTLLGKGSYLMSDGKTTDFWANFQKNIQCTTPPFATVGVKWYPRIKVNASGKASYSAGSTDGYCLYTYGWVNRIYEN